MLDWRQLAFLSAAHNYLTTKASLRYDDKTHKIVSSILLLIPGETNYAIASMECR
jgi:hypothetical protein